MEAAQSYPNLLSEKQAAKRLGVARITLLRAREAGRIRFFRIGTRVLYCAEQLAEFLNVCERNVQKRSHENEKQSEGQAIRSRVGAGPESADGRNRAGRQTKFSLRKKIQTSLPFSTSL